LNEIFNIKTEADFQAKCLETFLYQYENVEVYRKFVDFLGKNPSEIKEIKDIPFFRLKCLKIIKS
jgi:phenylacetate-coenzyme A ligase PaaK-like adenylate-forming protein